MSSEYAIIDSEFDNHINQAVELANSGRSEKLAKVYQFPVLDTYTAADVRDDNNVAEVGEEPSRKEVDSRLRMRDIAGLGAAALVMVTTREWGPAAGHLFDTIINR